ncbi:MAG: hypothetical protein SAK29_10910 [Scytonema sp. PMC 1069.18]|nr:hypothetical protein [Scytonema sp. PMC 1069.18]MEC4885350.1 hypothetical protein [Scytonema sp. PMC 1070.18]
MNNPELNGIGLHPLDYKSSRLYNSIVISVNPTSLQNLFLLKRDFVRNLVGQHNLSKVDSSSCDCLSLLQVLL